MKMSPKNQEDLKNDVSLNIEDKLKHKFQNKGLPKNEKTSKM